MSNPDDTDAMLVALTQTSDRLAAAVGDMSKRLITTERIQRQLATQQRAIQEQQQQTRRQRGVNTALALSLILDIVLSGGIALGYVRINHNAANIGEIQTRTSDVVLCPLYSLFLASVAHPRPDQVNTPEKKAEFEAATKTIKDGYTALGCQPALTERTGQ